jgi:hypothetical protein
MIRQILQSARLIFDIALIAAVVLLLYWWNPLGIFGGKAKLQPTANMIAEIIEMGELITAEYYGEVITSIQEAWTDSLANPEVTNQSFEAYSELKEMLARLSTFDAMTPDEKLNAVAADYPPLKRRDRNRLVLDRVSRNNILDKLIFREDWEAYELLPLHDQVLSFLYEKVAKEQGAIRNNLSNNQTKDLLFHLYPDKIDNYWNSQEFFAAYIQRKIKDAPRQEARKKLAMIGRGTVKAGFNLAELRPSMFYINEKAAELHFFGLAPKILNTDINPWFIPEKGIPGFDILTHSGKVNFKDAKKVKEFAIQKLEINAQRAGILTHAEQFGGETLKQLFSLITGKEIKKVFFHHDEIIQLAQQIIKDQFVNYEEAKLFEEQVLKEKRIIDSLNRSRENRYNNQQLARQKWQTLIQMTQQVQQFPFESENLDFNYFSTWIFQMGLDSLVESVERDTLRSVRDWLKTDANPSDSLLILWASGDSLSLMNQFSQSVGHLIQPSIQVGDRRTFTYSNDSINQEEVSAHSAQLLYRTDSTSVFRYLFIDSNSKKLLLDLLFPFTYSTDNWARMTSKRPTLLGAQQMDTTLVLENETGTIWIWDRKNNKNNPWKKVAITFGEIFNENLLDQSNGQKVILLEKDSLYLIQESKNLHQDWGSLQNPSWLSSEQQQEMTSYISNLLSRQYSSTHRGPVARANDWITTKFKSRSAIRINLER